jgi:hypothetical protein
MVHCVAQLLGIHKWCLARCDRRIQELQATLQKFFVPAVMLGKYPGCSAAVVADQAPAGPPVRGHDRGESRDTPRVDAHCLVKDGERLGMVISCRTMDVVTTHTMVLVLHPQQLIM